MLGACSGSGAYGRMEIGVGDVGVGIRFCARTRRGLTDPPTRPHLQVRRLLQWYGAYYGVTLPSAMSPNRKEASDLRTTYDIQSAIRRGSRQLRGRRTAPVSFGRQLGRGRCLAFHCSVVARSSH